VVPFTLADAIALALVIPPAAAVLCLIAGVRSRCPRCRRWWAVRQLDRDVTSVDVCRRGAAVTRTTHALVDECRHCGEVLLRTEVEEGPPVRG
jgi:uncharacterized protein (DUF983 family)